MASTASGISHDAKHTGPRWIKSSQSSDNEAHVPSRDSKRGSTLKRELHSLVTQMHSAGVPYTEALRQFKRRYLLEVLAHHKGNQCKAAEELGMHRNTWMIFCLTCAGTSFWKTRLSRNCWPT